MHLFHYDVNRILAFVIKCHFIEHVGMAPSGRPAADVSLQC